MDKVRPATHGFGLYGRDFGYPSGGLCVSAFAVVRDAEDRVLVGRMRDVPRWAEEWAPNVAYYDGARRDALFAGLRLPATYLREGEHPDAAARRVLRDQLGLVGASALPAPLVVSEAGPSRRTPDALHWDLAFVYDLRGPDAAPAPAVQWDALRYVDPTSMTGSEFVMLHGELLDVLRRRGQPS